jgi:hypothetical protein
VKCYGGGREVYFIRVSDGGACRLVGRWTSCEGEQAVTGAGGWWWEGTSDAWGPAARGRRSKRK